MHEHSRKARRASRLRLPMAMTKHATMVCGIDFDGLSDGRKTKGWARKKIADNSLQMAVGEPGMRLKRAEPGWNLPD